jgi:hypothetical protein
LLEESDFFEDFFEDLSEDFFEDFFDDFFFDALSVSDLSMLPLDELAPPDLSLLVWEKAGIALNAKTAAIRTARVRIIGDSKG